MLGWPVRTQDSLLIMAVRGFRHIQSTLAGGGGEGYLNTELLYGEVPPRGPTPYPFIYHFFTKKIPLSYTFY